MLLSGRESGVTCQVCRSGRVTVEDSIWMLSSSLLLTADLLALPIAEMITDVPSNTRLMKGIIIYSIITVGRRTAPMSVSVKNSTELGNPFKCILLLYPFCKFRFYCLPCQKRMDRLISLLALLFYVMAVLAWVCTLSPPDKLKKEQAITIWHLSGGFIFGSCLEYWCSLRLFLGLLDKTN